MVCRVELERSILQSWLTNFTSNTKKIQENRKNPLKMWYTNRQYRKKAEYGRIFYGRSKI